MSPDNSNDVVNPAQPPLELAVAAEAIVTHNGTQSGAAIFSHPFHVLSRTLTYCHLYHGRFFK